MKYRYYDENLDVSLSAVIKSERIENSIEIGAPILTWEAIVSYSYRPLYDHYDSEVLFVGEGSTSNEALEDLDIQLKKYFLK